MIVCVTKHLFRIIDSLIYHHSCLSTRLVNLPWDGVDPLHRQWFNGLRQPDNPTLSCCGEVDAYWADSYEVNGDQYVAIITDARDDEPLHRSHVENGTRFAVTNTKIKWDLGNPTGHGIIFIGYLNQVLCYLPPGGGQPCQAWCNQKGPSMKLKLIVAILVIAAVPVCAQAQPPSATKVTKASAKGPQNYQ